MQTITVNLGNRSYPIHVGHDILADIGSTYKSAGLGKTAAVVTNPTVAKLYLKTVEKSLRDAGIKVQVVTMPEGEEHKTFHTAGKIHGDLMQAGLDRGSCILALGGGVVGDTAGFVAATYLRGIDFVQVPTTLEAQVDASIGGKTGVDHPLGKNMIGAFYQPKFVQLDTRTLKTLPDRELRAGMAEVVKHGLIRNLDLVTFLEERIDDVLDGSLDADGMDRLIAQNCQIKTSVVEEDEREAGLREILNYGHTVGHAIEAVTEYKIYKHGEAVILGMIAAGKIATERGMWSEEELGRQNRLLEKVGIAGGAEELDAGELLERMASDKKARDGVIRFVLPEKIGKVKTIDTVAQAEMEAGIQYMQEWSGKAGD